MDREPAEARFCAECNRCHSAEEGDLWAESSMLGLRITYFACMDGKVYDITGERVNPLHKHDFYRSFHTFTFSQALEKDRVMFLPRSSWPRYNRSHLIFVACLLCVSEWAGCQRIGISPDTHRVPYHISFGSKNNNNPSRHRCVPFYHACCLSLFRFF